MFIQVMYMQKFKNFAISKQMLNVRGEAEPNIRWILRTGEMDAQKDQWLDCQQINPT